MNCKISVIFAFVLHIYLHWCKARYFISGAKELLSADSPYITFLKFVTFSSLLIEKGSHKLHTMPTVLVVFWARPSRSFFKIFISYVCIYIYIYIYISKKCNIWYLLLRNFWSLLPKFYISGKDTGQSALSVVNFAIFGNFGIF